MGKIARQRSIENLSGLLLNLYRQHEPNDPELSVKQNEILAAYKVQLQSEGKSRTTINDYLSCAVVKALNEYDKELKKR